MTKKIGLILEGISNLKIFGSLIKEANNFDIEIFLILARDGGGKDYDIISGEVLENHFPDSIRRGNLDYYDENKSVVEIAKENNTSVVVCINPYHKFSQEIASLNSFGIPTFGLDYFINSVYAAAREGEKNKMELALSNITERLVWSDYFKELEFKVAPQNRAYENKFFVTGSPLLDVYKYIDPDKTKKSLGLPENRKLITIYTPNVRKKDLLHLYGFFPKTKIKKTLSVFKNFAAKRNWEVVIKSRKKQWDSDFYRCYSDFFVYDPYVFPSTSSLLMVGSEIVIHFGSMGVFEAGACGVPSLGVAVPAIDKMHHYMMPGSRRIIKEEMFENKPGRPFNFGSVSQGIDIGEGEVATERVCNYLAHHKNENEFREFNKKFSDFDGKPAYEKIFYRIQKYL